MPIEIPVGITVDNNEKIFVTNQGYIYNQIQKLTSEGTLTASIGKYGSGKLHFDVLVGISFIH